MFIQKNILFFSFICTLMSSVISASQEPIIQQASAQNVIQKIESWASIASDATYSSWQDTQSDFLTFLEKVDQMRILAENNSFFEDDDDDEDDSDDEESDNESVSSDEEGETPDYTIGNNSMNQLLSVNLIQIKK